MTTEELATKMVAWLKEQEGIADVALINTDFPPFGADPARFLGRAYLGFVMDGIPMSLEMSVTE